ncbi:MAG: ABC transporter substrate-binding protein [Clostridiaceae bacterium]
MKKSIYKKVSILLTVLMATSALFVGCGTSSTDDGEEKVTLNYLMFDDFEYNYVTETVDLNKEYQKTHPNVTIEFEKSKDSTEFQKTLKIRNSADELPDIMAIKPFMLASYVDVLADLTDTEAAKNNTYADQYAVEGKIVGVPTSCFYEFVYYRKSIFEKYDLEIPQTWDEFIDVANTIKEKGEVVPILLGAKDAWTDYPYNEYMPLLESGNGAYWNEMATIDEPFSEGMPFNTAYKKIQKLYDEDVFGEDPLGVGNDQVTAKFNAGEGAMIASGQWFAAKLDSTDDVGVFFLPARDTEDSTLYATVMADLFLSTPKDGENKDASIEFINWYLSSDYYETYLGEKGIDSPMEGVEVSNDFINQAFDTMDPTFIVVDGGNSEFTRIQNAINFNVKELGQEMLLGQDFDEMMDKLNEQWKEAKNTK